MATLLPAETVGYVAAGDLPDLVDRWQRTQLGQLAADATMRPFIDQVRARLNRQMGGLETRLGVTLADFRDAATGQAAMAIVKSSEKDQPGRVVALVDATGRDAEAAALLAKVDAKLIERGGNRRVAGPLTIYDLPEEPAYKLSERTVAVFHVQGVIGAAEGEKLASGLVARLTGPAAGDNLASARAFVETQRRALAAAGHAAPSVAWFISPFEYEAATREPPADGELPDKKDTLAILAEQGFDAVTGIGGAVMVSANAAQDFIHHTFVYAPPKPGTEQKPHAERYELAMRMLDFPNAGAPLNENDPPVELWAPRQVATYKTIHLDLQNAFQHLGTLFDAFAGYEGAFETTLRGWEVDYYGPKVNLRGEVIPHLGQRVVVMTDYTLPITTECERYLVAIDVTNEEALRDPVNRWLKNEPGAELKRLRDVEYWELVPVDEAAVADDPLAAIDDEPTGPLGDNEERVLQHAAVCLHQDRLLIASDADFLRQALFGVSPGESLGASPDLAATLAALRQIAPGERCAWTFARNDEALRPTYELVRAGEMPQSQTFFGRLLNRLLTTDEQREVDELREQKIDGRRLPTFELARRYFGPSARSVRTEGDGWLISGVVLSKAPHANGPAAAVARR